MFGTGRRAAGGEGSLLELPSGICRVVVRVKWMRIGEQICLPSVHVIDNEVSLTVISLGSLF